MSFTLHRGHTPLLISMPHVGTHLPEALRPRLVERALQVEDTDWHLDRLYAFAKDIGASLIVPVESRIVIDLNRGSEPSAVCRRPWPFAPHEPTDGLSTQKHAARNLSTLFVLRKPRGNTRPPQYPSRTQTLFGDP